MPARMLRQVLVQTPVNDDPVLLDVGSGGLGVATFLKGVRAIGIDRAQPTNVCDGLVFHQGDITALPYLDKSFPVVSCIDVLEHLSLGAREAAIGELVRVASHAVLIACPHGETARECDEAFRRACEARGRDIPGWLAEHQTQSYPVGAQILRDLHKAAISSGRVASISLSYSEPASVCRAVRAAAARSNFLYIATNLVLGTLFSFMHSPDAENSYRVIALAELT
ncbi:MAG: class I SAM-dependent methyltransferase [Blastocatellia bacterium]